MKKSLVLILTLLALSACETLPNKAYSLPVRPESLLDSSAERVSFGLSIPKSAQELTDWINKDQPSRAELNCAKDKPNCRKAIQILSSFSVPYKHVQKAGGDSIALVYNRVVARSCNHSFISNHHNVRNLNHPAFGCSVASNTLQMMSDQQQILNPLLSGNQDAATQVRRLNAYENRSTRK